jgi:hypothetical protein
LAKTSNKQSTKIKPLTLQEEKFVASYIQNGGNGAAAVLSAGYKCKAKGSAKAQATRLLTRAYLSENIAKRRAELRTASNVSAQEVIQVLAAHMRSDVTDLMGTGGSFDLKRIHAEGLGRLIKKVGLRRIPGRKATSKTKATPAYVFVEKMELYSAQSAANQLCKILGIEQEKGKNKNDPAYLKKLLEERIAFGIEGFRRNNVILTRRDVLEMFADAPESAGDLFPLIQAELASEKIQ